MWLDEESTIRKQDLVFSKPFVNSPGTLGFTPDPRAMPFMDHLGAFITNPISRQPRSPAANRCCLPFQGGFLLHTGLQNPGIRHAIHAYKNRWASASLPVIVHLLVESPESLAEMVQMLEGLDNILALELGIPPNCDPDSLPVIFNAARGELPVIICLNPEQIPLLLGTVKILKPVAVHLTEPRGALPGPDGEITTGRLYGPANFPLLLHATGTLVNADLQVITSGGVVAYWQVEILLNKGVLAVGLGSVLWQLDQESVFVKQQLL